MAGVEWLRKAAKLGDAEAQYRLGCCFSEGEVPPACFCRSTPVVSIVVHDAKVGGAEAQYRLGCCFWEGEVWICRSTPCCLGPHKILSWEWYPPFRSGRR